MILDLLRGIYYIGGVAAIFVAIFILRKKVIKLMDEDDELRIKISTEQNSSESDDKHNQSNVEQINNSTPQVIGLIAVTRTPFGWNAWKWFSDHQYGFVLIPELINKLHYAIDTNRHQIKQCQFYYYVPVGDKHSCRYSKRAQTIGGSLTLSCIPVVEVWTDRTLYAAEQYADLFEKMMIDPLHILLSDPFPELDRLYKTIRERFSSTMSATCLVHPSYRDVNLESHISQEILEEAWREPVVQEKEEKKSKAYIIPMDSGLQQLFENGSLKTKIADTENDMIGDVIDNVTLIRNDADPNTVIVLKDDKE